jgi:hypothetical protein
MSNQNWVSLINAGNTGPGTALVTGTTKTTISPCQAGALTADVALVNPAGQPLGWYAGLLIRVSARFYITTTATASNLTFTLESNKGNTGTYVIMASTGAIVGTTTVLTGLQCKFEAWLRCTAIAASGNTILASGEVEIPNNATVPTINGVTNGVLLKAPMPQASGETASAVDTTSLQGLSLRCTPSISAGVNPIQVTEWLAEALC